jgi:hypothetical protein
VIFSTAVSFPWGEEGHRLITCKSIETLPGEPGKLRDWEDLIADRSSDADKRREFDSTEIPRHYIDIDFYEEFRQGKMIKEFTGLTEIYGDSTVYAMGILPWATLDTYQKLITAFKKKNKEMIIRYTSDLAHYVQDGHQPMHTILNYDGQLTGQKGIHYRYESEMINRYLSHLTYTVDPSSVKYIADPLDFIFEYITAANSYSGLLFEADNFSFNECGSRDDLEYYRLLWFKTQYITVVQFKSASESLASLIYSAWVDAGKPSLQSLD